MGALKMAAAEKERIFAPVESSARRPANPVTDLIADNGAEHYGKQQPFERNHPSGGKDAGGDKQGIPGKKEANKETGFNKYDSAN
jgi:hypothetical protein